MNEVFAGVTANDVWMSAMRHLQTQDNLTQDSRLGITREVLHASFRILNPRQRWILSREPALNPAFGIAEVIWILGGDNDSKFLNYWNPGLPGFAGSAGRYHGAYGFRIRKHFGFDQLEKAYYAFKSNPLTRQIVIQIWDSRIDFPNLDGTPVDSDIPCNICSILKIRNGNLEWLQIMRSNDIYRGTPYNFNQFTSLQEILAGWLGVGVGEYHQVSDSLHVYETDEEKVSIADNVPQLKNEDSLAISKEDFDRIFPTIYSSFRKLSHKRLSKVQFDKIINIELCERGFVNLLLIAAADSARRRGWNIQMNSAIKLCTNSMLLYAWTQWEKRRPCK